MMIIYFLLILGVTIFVHELGHFIFAKKVGIHVYEFALGMGPRLFSFRRSNDETIYAIRLIPLGGFVQLAGEEVKDDERIPANKKLQNKTIGQRFITMASGVLFNFLLAIVLLFAIGLIYGAPETRPIVGEVPENFPTYDAGLKEGDMIIRLDGKRVYTWDDVLLYIELLEPGSPLKFEIKKESGAIDQFTITPILVDEDGESSYKYGISLTNTKNYGFVAAIKFTAIKFITVINSMVQVLFNLFTGNLGFNNLAGPIGIYSIVNQEVSNGLMNVLYLISFLSINVGFINLLPIPAFDGGRLLFLLIEKIKGSPINPKTENIIHSIGFALLLILMLFITIQDIRKLFF
ncbi:MAG: RIP metalloprotease RseP [Bacilli bacterium]|jgi:regulator of sigma E protease|nr:RIP metalloprotease RseP [Bacilli bacterium]